MHEAAYQYRPQSLSLRAFQQVHRLEFAVTSELAGPFCAAACETHRPSGFVTRDQRYEAVGRLCQSFVPKARAVRTRKLVEHTVREDASVRCLPALDMDSCDVRRILNHSVADTPFA